MSRADLEQSGRERSEQELKAARERLDLLVEATLDGIYDWDLVTGALWHSARLERLLGYGDAEALDTIERWKSLLHPDDRKQAVEALDAHLEHGRPYAVDYRFRTTDGGYRWFYDQGHAIRDDQGRAVRMVGSLHDVTDRVEAEAARTRFGRIIENSLNEIYIADAESFRFVQVNSGARANLQYSAEEIRGLTPLDIAPEYTAESLEKLVAPLRSGEREQLNFETIHKRKDATTYEVAVRLQLMAEESPPVFVAFIEDITERKRAERDFTVIHERLEASEALFRSMTANLPGAIYRCLADEYWTDIFMSDAIEPITGYPASDFIGTRVRTFESIVHPDDLESYRAPAPKTAKEGPDVAEYRIIHADGSVHWLHDRSRATYAENGEILWIDGAIFDITAQKRTEEAFNRSEAAFRSMVENVPGAIHRCAIDDVWTMQFMSDAIEQITGYPASDFINNRVRSYASVIHPDDVEGVARTVAAAVARREPTVIEYRIRRRDGSIRHVRGRGQAAFDETGEVLWWAGAIFDITERKEAEAALAAESRARRESEKRFRNMVANVPGVIYRCAAEDGWPMVYMSEAVEPICGYPASDFIDNRVRAFSEIIHPDDREDFASVGRRLAEGGPIESEYRIFHADGSIRWVYEHAQGVRAEDGRLRWLDGAIFDVTARKQAEQEARASEQQFRSIVANIPGVVYRAGPDGWSMQYVSERVREITGRPASFYVETGFEGFLDLVHPDDRERVEKTIAESLCTRTPLEIEYRFVHADGSVRWARESARPVCDAEGRVVFVDGVIFDITKSKESEVRLRHSEARLANAQRIAGLGGWEWNLETRELVWGDEIYRLFGLEPGAFAPSYERFLAFVHPDDRAAMDAAVERCLATGEPYSLDFRVICPDGTIRICEDHGEPVRGESGAPSGLVGTVQDITARRRAEERLRNSEASLANAQRIARMGNWDWDLTSGELAWSDELYRIYGRDAQSFEPSYESFLDMLHPDDRETVRAGLERAIARRRPVDQDYRIILPRGDERMIHARMEFAFDESGKPIRVSGTDQDITERCRAEEALRKSEASLATAQRIARVGSWEWSPPSGALSWSDELYRIFGRDPETFEQSPEAFYEAVHPDDREKVREAVENSLARCRPFEIDYRIVLPDGGVRLVHEQTEIAEARDGEAVRVNGTVQDITEPKRAEERLRESEASLANAQRIAHIGNWDWDLSSDETRWSDEVFRIVGAEPQSFRPNPERIMELVHPDDRERLHEVELRARETLEPYSCEYRLVRPDGEPRVVHETCEIATGDDGAPVRMSGTIQDVTERRRAEERLRKSEASLANAQRIAHIGNWDWDLTSDGMYWSDEIYRMLGRGPEACEPTAEAFYPLVHPDDVDTLRRAVECARADGEPYRLIFRIFRPDGEERVIEEQVEVARDAAGRVWRISGTDQDITDRRRAERELRETLERLDLVINATIDCIYDWNVRTDELWHSARLGDVLGYDLDEVSDHPKGWLTRLHPDDRHRVAALIDDHLAGKKPFEIEYRVRAKSGDYLWLHDKGQAVWDLDGRPLRMVGSLHDITERKRAEERLRASEAQLRVIAENVPVMIAYIDRDEVFRYANKAEEEWYQRSADQLVGKTVREIVGEGNYPRLKPYMDRVLAGEAVDSETEYDCPRRGRRAMLTHRIPHFDDAGEVLGYFAVIEDITERKRAEETLRTSEAQLRLITDNVPAIIIYVDRDQICRFANKARNDWSGDADENIVGKHLREFVTPESYEQNRPLIERALRGETNDGEHVAEHATRGRRVLHTTRVPHFSEDGEVLGYLAVVEDVTERKALEEQLRQKQKIEAVGQLAGGISHEVNNMLTPIIGLTEMSLGKLPADSGIRSNLEMVLQASGRVEEMVKRILAFSRADAEKTLTFPLGAAVAEAMPLIRATLPSTIEVDVRIDPQAGVVIGNPTAIQQILMNLATNAARAMEAEGGRLEITLEAVEIDQGAAARNLDLAPGPYALLSVIDTGCGMDDETLQRIFEPFFTTRPVGGGTGLGLSVVHGIVKKHGGAIAVDSEPGGGTRVRIHFPLADAGAPALAAGAE